MTLTLHIEHSGSQDDGGMWCHYFTLGSKYCAVALEEMDPEPDVALDVERMVQFSLFIGPISSETLIPMIMAANDQMLIAKNATDEEFDAAMAKIQRAHRLTNFLNMDTLYF